MKTSFKYLLLFFAVCTMSIVSCSDDDGGDEPTPKPPTNDTMPNDTMPTNTEMFSLIANGDTVIFTSYSVTLDDFSRPTNFQIIMGSKSSPNESMNIDMPENFVGTANYPGAADKVITYRRDGATFNPVSGFLTISQNDSVVAGTFEFVGKPLFGSDTLAVTNGRFYIRN